MSREHQGAVKGLSLAKQAKQVAAVNIFLDARGDCGKFIEKPFTSGIRFIAGARKHLLAQLSATRRSDIRRAFVVVAGLYFI